MPHFKIIRSALPPYNKRRRFECLELETGELDYLGQILYQMGHRGLEKKRLPSELKEVIPPFTTHLRGKVVDTMLTHRIIHLDSLPRKELEPQLQTMLEPHGITLIFQD